eukprot:366283-Chlamydomonas_euryale.AAC.2
MNAHKGDVACVAGCLINGKGRRASEQQSRAQKRQAMHRLCMRLTGTQKSEGKRLGNKVAEK